MASLVRRYPVLVLAIVGLGAAMVLGLFTPAPAAASEVKSDAVCDGVELADEPLEIGSLGVTGEPVEPIDRIPAVPRELLPSGVEQIRLYDIDVTVNPDGSADFTETIEYDFGRTPNRHGIFRDMRLTQPCNSEWERVYPLTQLQVSSPTGAPAGWVIEHQGGLTRVRIGSADINVKGVHTYVISYRLDGVVNAFADRVEFYWNVVGDQWPTTLWNVDVTVTGPGAPLASRCFAGATGSTDGCGEVVATETGMHVTQPNLFPYEGMTVALAYPPSAFTATPRYYDEVWSIQRAFSLTPLTVGGSAALLAGAIIGVIALGYHIGRDRRAIGAATDIAFASTSAEGVPVPLFESSDSPVEFIPPDGLRPAQFALIRNEEVRNVDISATIVDLAVRGLIRIEESGGSKRRPDYRLMRLEMSTDGLLEYERTLMTRLFSGMTEVQLSDLEDTFASDLQRVRDAVYADGVGRGWYAERPDKVKARWRGIGFVLVLLGAGLLGAAIAWTKVALLPIPVIIAGILVFAFAGRFPRRTPAGTGLRRRVGGFELFMTDSEAPRAKWAENRSIFSEYLPFAIVLGITKRWARTFEPLGAEAVAATTTWYVGQSAFSFDRFSSATDRFTSTAGSTLASTPQSSSGSSGFSGGGGSSGGGGGGGGGGSW